MKKWSLLGLIVLGAVVGAAGVVGFNATLSYTNTDDFCLSCHNHRIPYESLRRTSHYSNASGVVAGCADCHVPHEFGPKMMRKIAAVREVYGHFTGIIDSDEKYLAHQEEMAAREVERFRANDSATCRNCHKVSRMDPQLQSSVASKKHRQLAQGKTCIDCHQGLAHPPLQQEDDFGF